MTVVGITRVPKKRLKKLVKLIKSHDLGVRTKQKPSCWYRKAFQDDHKTA